MRNGKTVIGLVIGQLSQGGAERQITALAAGLLNSDQFHPVVLCLSTHTMPYAQALTQAGVTWSAPPKEVVSPFGKLRWLIKSLRALDCSLVYGFLNIGNIYTGLAAHVLRIPYITSIRSANTDFDRIIKLLSVFFMQRSNFVIANSPACLDVLRKDLHVSHDRVTVIPNIIEPIRVSTSARKQLRAAWGVSENELVVGTISLLKSGKRPDLFIEVFKSLNETLPAHFVWVGDGPARRRMEDGLERLPHHLGARFHFEGFQTNIDQYLSAFDLFFLPSAFEGSSNALLEAMSAGIPTIGMFVPGVRDIFGDEAETAGAIVLCTDAAPVKIARRIEDLLLDQEALQRIRDTAYRLVIKHHGRSGVLASNEDVFRKTVARSGNATKR